MIVTPVIAVKIRWGLILLLKISYFRQKESPDFHQGVRGIFTKLLFNFGAVEEFDRNPEEEQEVGRGDDWRQVEV